jgi:hypothetical protein
MLVYCYSHDKNKNSKFRKFRERSLKGDNKKTKRSLLNTTGFIRSERRMPMHLEYEKQTAASLLVNLYDKVFMGK